MNYYIIGKKIIGFENELDNELYNYQKLNKEQADFYELHKCSLQEVLNLALNPIYEPTLQELKEQKILEYSQLAFDIRRELIPDYKIDNAALGIYDEIETNRIKSIIQAFRNEFYRLKALVDNANTIEELNSIEHNYNGIVIE